MKKSYTAWTNNALLLASSVLIASTGLAAPSAQAAQKFNVKNFGATGNGVTDDTSAIQSALTAANAAPGSTLVFPPGNYLYSNVLVANGISVTGQNATLTATSSGAELELTGNHVSLNGMTFSSQVATLFTIFVSQANGFAVTNNVINANTENPLVIGNSSNGNVQLNSIALTSNGSLAITLGQANHVSILQNVITGTGNNTGLGFGNCSNISITSNRVSGVKFGANEGANMFVSYQNNVFSNFSSEGVSCGSDQNLTISGNQFFATGLALGMVLGGTTNALVVNNSIQNGSIGIDIAGNTNIQVGGNTFSNNQAYGVLGGGNTSPTVTGNTIVGTGVGINLGGDSNNSITGNKISNCQNEALLFNGSTGTESISNNQLSNCQLGTGDSQAVIFVDSAGASSIPIIHNTYKGNTANLLYFIWCKQTQPPAQISGNITNTTLPNRIGF